MIGQVAAVVGQTLTGDVVEAKGSLSCHDLTVFTENFHTEVAQQVAPFDIGSGTEG